MITYELDISPAFDKQLEKFAAYDEIANKHLTEAMQGSLLGIQGFARSNAPVFQGRMRNSLQTEVRTLGGDIQGRIFSDIRSPYPYPAVMELGRKPGKMPPVSALRRWVQLVLRPPASQVNGIAYIVARAIGRRGIKGRYFIKNAIESSKVRIGMLHREAVNRIAEEMAVK